MSKNTDIFHHDHLPAGRTALRQACRGWHYLFSLANGYDVVYHWFDYLKRQGHYIVGYVHALIAFRHTDKLVNKVVAMAKRFMP